MTMIDLDHQSQSKIGAGFVPLAAVSIGGVAGGMSYLSQYGDDFNFEAFATSIAFGATTACFGTLGVAGRAIGMFNAANTKVVIQYLQFNDSSLVP